MREYLASTLNGMYGGITAGISIWLVPIVCLGFTFAFRRWPGRRAKLYAGLSLAALALLLSLPGVLPRWILEAPAMTSVLLATIYLAPYSGLHVIDVANVLVFWVPVIGSFAYAASSRRPNPLFAAAIGAGLVVLMFALFWCLVVWSDAPIG